MTDATRKSLGDYVHVKHGFAFKGEYFTDDPTPDVLVTPGNFAIGGGFQDEKPKYYAGPVPAEYVLEQGDLVITMTDLSKAGDTLGYPALIPSSTGRRYLHNQRVGLVEIDDEEQVDKRFLYYRLCANDYRHHILATASGSTVRHTSPGRIGQFETTLPAIDEQRAIAGLLGALDDKIEQNRRTAQSLERLARAIFRAWLVDFEPVKAKAAGAIAFPSMTQRVFDSLPTRFVGSAIGPVPEGWEVGELGDIAAQRKEGVRPEELDDETPYVGLEHIPRRCIALTEWSSAEQVTSGKARFSAGQILFGKLRPYFHKVVIAPIDGVCSTDIVVIEPKQALWHSVVFGHAASDEFVAHATACSTGTKMPRTNWRDMASFKIAVPPTACGAALTEVIGPMLDVLSAGILECRKLGGIRDDLLPKLLSGAVRVHSSLSSGARGND
ncbi:MAG: restriction endonuclease subunit S [Burkholderiaceae bacterium]